MNIAMTQDELAAFTNIWKDVLLTNAVMRSHDLPENLVDELHGIMKDYGYLVPKYIKVLHNEADIPTCVLNAVVGVISIILLHGLVNPISGPVFFGLIHYFVYLMMLATFLIFLATLNELRVSAKYVYKARHVRRRYQEFCSAVIARKGVCVSERVKKMFD